MTPSIRTYLLINLLLSVTLITSLAIVGNLFLAHQDIQIQLDAQLVRSTVRLQEIFSGPETNYNFSAIQKQINRENNYLSKLKGLKSLKPAAILQAERNFEFQIWNAQKELLLHSKYAITQPFSTSKAAGISAKWVGGHRWHVNTAHNDNGLTIIVAERADYRQELENRLTQDSIVVMLVTYPFLGFLIWIIVGRGLSSLQRIATELNHRDPNYLEPVAFESVPSEIAPLIKELNNLFSKLQEAFEREKRFTADAAHELKTPLAALSAQTQVALCARNEKDLKEALHKVLMGVRRSTHVVQQLLTLSRMEPHAGLTDTVTTNLAKEATEVIGMLAPEAIEKNIDLEFLAPDSQAKITANTTAIAILIRNLIDNAIRYSPPDSTVTIDIRENENTVTLIVSDDGPGIPEKLRKRVFERFFRVIGNNTIGSGLGLSIVQKIAELHNAIIELHTPPSGKGVAFHIVFPRAH